MQIADIEDQFTENVYCILQHNKACYVAVIWEF